MKSLGFDVWLQPVMVPRWIRGDTEEAIIVESDFFQGRKLGILALGRSVGTDENGITAGVIEVKNYKELESRKEEIRGKIVFFNSSIDPGLANTFRGYGEGVTYRSSGAIEAAKYGAEAVLIKSLTTRFDNVPHTGAMMNYV